MTSVWRRLIQVKRSTVPLGWQTAIHTVTSVLTLLLIALLENAGRRSEEAPQEKLNMIAEPLAALMASRAVEDDDIEEAATKLREAIGLEERH